MHRFLPLACLVCTIVAAAARTITFVNKSMHTLTVSHHKGETGKEGTESICVDLQPNQQCTHRPSGHHQYFANNAWKTTAMFRFDWPADDEYRIVAYGRDGFDFGMEIKPSKRGATKVECLTVYCMEDKRTVSTGGDFTVTFCDPPAPATEGKSSGAGKKTGGAS